MLYGNCFDLCYERHFKAKNKRPSPAPNKINSKTTIHLRLNLEPGGRVPLVHQQQRNVSDSQYREKQQIQNPQTSLCCWSSPAAVGSSAAIVVCSGQTSPLAFIAAVITWAANMHIPSIMHPLVPIATLKKWSLEKLSLHKWGKCLNLLNLHLFRERIQNWQLKKTKTRIEFHLQGYFSAVSPSLQTPNSRA